MNRHNSSTRRWQLDASLGKLLAVIPSRPSKGWIREIRSALLLTTKQLAKRLKVEQSTITRLEQSEARSSISLASLEKIADALNCEFRYVLIPRESLESQVFHQAEKALAKEDERIEHSQALEGQETEYKRRLNADVRAALFLHTHGSKIWDEE